MSMKSIRRAFATAASAAEGTLGLFFDPRPAGAGNSLNGGFDPEFLYFIDRDTVVFRNIAFQDVTWNTEGLPAIALCAPFRRLP
jgi:hypothetical protein